MAMDPKMMAAGALSAAAAAYVCGLGGAKPQASALPTESGSLVLFVNGVQVTALPHEIHPRMTLLEFLRENLGLTGAKLSCNQGGCGACTVMLDGTTRRSCVTPVSTLEGANIQTIEGLDSPEAQAVQSSCPRPVCWNPAGHA